MTKIKKLISDLAKLKPDHGSTEYPDWFKQYCDAQAALGKLEIAELTRRRDEIKRQLLMAKRVVARCGQPAIITETRLTKQSTKTFFGFRCQQGCVGQEFQNDDGSFSVVRAAITPNT